MSALRAGSLLVYLAVTVVSLLATIGLAYVSSLVALLFALVPAAIYWAATRDRGRIAVAVLGSLLLVQGALYATAVPAYDDDAQGALLFFFVPFWGALGLGIGWGIVAGIEGWRRSRRRP